MKDSEVTEPSMKAIVMAIAANLDVRSGLIDRAIIEGFAEWVKSAVLTDKGKKFLGD